MGFRMASEWELVTRENKTQLEAWAFQPHQPFSWEERRAGNGVNDPLHLHEEASLKSQQYKVQRASSLANASTPEVWGTPTAGGQKLLHLGPSQTSPLCISSSGCSSATFITLLKKLVNVSVSLSSVSSSSKLIKPKEGSYGNLWFIAKSDRSCR